MPIKPDNRWRYPADWEARRARVLKRAGNCCELCAAPNGRFIKRGKRVSALWRLRWGGGHGFDEDEWRKPIKVVLTIAHLDRDYKDHDDKFLLALCQRCHLRIDAHQRAVERRKSKEAIR